MGPHEDSVNLPALGLYSLIVGGATVLGAGVTGGLEDLFGQEFYYPISQNDTFFLNSYKAGIFKSIIIFN